MTYTVISLDLNTNLQPAVRDSRIASFLTTNSERYGRFHSWLTPPVYEEDEQRDFRAIRAIFERE